MTDEKLGTLFEAFAHYYWSIPVSHVINRIADWHSDVMMKQVVRALDKCNKNLFWHHCCVMEEGLDEPELVTEHLVAIGGEDYDNFIAARIDAPFCECTEHDLLKMESESMDIPEARAIIDFGKQSLGLDDEWAKQLLDDCILNQPYALCDRKSWVMSVLQQERYGKIHFRTIEQVMSFRALGNNFYRVMPNPVLRGWKPEELENLPKLPDDIPEKNEDIPDGRTAIDELFAPFGGREKAGQVLLQRLSGNPKSRKIGRNEQCPCGSGLKFKKCTCTQYHAF